MKSLIAPHLRALALGALFSFLGLGIVGCESSMSPTDSKGSSAVGSGSASVGPENKAVPIKVIMGLNWFPEAEHGGFYAALVHGYYKEAGLDVTIQPGGPDVPIIQQLATNQIQCGVDNADKLLLVRVQEADVVATMSPMQISPRSIMVHAKTGPKSFEELAKIPGMVLSMNAGQPFAMYMQKKLDLSKATVVPYAGSVAQFLLEEKYAQQAYNFSEPFTAEQQGGDPHNLMVSDLGFNPYTSVLLFSSDYLKANRDVAARLTAASIKGWRKYLENPDETNDYIRKQNPEMTKEILDYGVKVLRPLCITSDVPLEKVGQMTAARWNELVQQLEEIEAIPAGKLKPEEAYTLDFLSN